MHALYHNFFYILLITLYRRRDRFSLVFQYCDHQNLCFVYPHQLG